MQVWLLHIEYALNTRLNWSNDIWFKGKVCFSVTLATMERLVINPMTTHAH